MVDKFNKETHSYNMSQIKGKDTKPEILVREICFQKGYDFERIINYIPELWTQFYPNIIKLCSFMVVFGTYMMDVNML